MLLVLCLHGPWMDIFSLGLIEYYWKNGWCHHLPSKNFSIESGWTVASERMLVSLSYSPCIFFNTSSIWVPNLKATEKGRNLHELGTCACIIATTFWARNDLLAALPTPRSLSWNPRKKHRSHTYTNPNDSSSSSSSPSSSSSSWYIIIFIFIVIIIFFFIFIIVIIIIIINTITFIPFIIKSNIITCMRDFNFYPQSSSCWILSIFLPKTSTQDGRTLIGLVFAVTAGNDILGRFGWSRKTRSYQSCKIYRHTSHLKIPAWKTKWHCCSWWVGGVRQHLQEPQKQLSHRCQGGSCRAGFPTHPGNAIR